MTFTGLTSPPQGSYAPDDLAWAVVTTFWPALLLAATLTLLPDPRPRHRAPTPALASTLPFLVWALQSSLEQIEWWSGIESYFLWHRLIVSILALVGVVGILAITLGASRLARPGPTAWPNPLWVSAVVLPPLIDQALLIFFVSPIAAVLRQ